MAFLLNLIFSIVEIIGGILTNSVAIMADALHDLGDSASLGLAWYFEKVATRKRDHTFTYGYGRFSLLAAFINGIILLTGSLIILNETIPRLFNPEEVNTRGMIILAILGVIFNGLAALRIKKGESMNEKMIFWHLWEDILGWVAVLVGGIVMYFFDVPILDPILSIAFTCFILFQVLKNLKKVFQIFMQGIPLDVDSSKIEHEVEGIRNVDSVHDIHIWSLDGSKNIMTIHVKLEDDKGSVVPIDRLALKSEIRNRIKKYNIEHVTIELETQDEDCEYRDC